MSDKALAKVPQVTLLYWITKIIATTLGETGGDMVSMTFNLGYLASTFLFLTVFFVAFGAQMVSRRFNPWLYWLVILATSTAGTTMSDFMDRTLKLGYQTGTLVLVSLLVIVLVVWRLVQGSLSVDKISGGRAEAFYWLAILVSNTLGTALGDYLADSSGLGFMKSAALIAGALVVITGLHFFTRVSKVVLFWAAFVLTRPFGATFGDLLTKKEEIGGLNLGTTWSSAVLFALLLGLVVWQYYSARGKPASERKR